MKNIDYKKLKRYDIGKLVINRGYQTNPDNFVQPIETIKNIESTTNMNRLLIGQNLSTIGTNLTNTVNNIYKNLQYVKANANNAAENSVPGVLSAGSAGASAATTGATAANVGATGLNTAGGVVPTEISVTGTTGGAASGAASGIAFTASKFLPYVGIASGLYGMASQASDAGNTVDGGMIKQMSGKNIHYVDGGEFLRTQEPREMYLDEGR